MSQSGMFSKPNLASKAERNTDQQFDARRSNSAAAHINQCPRELAPVIVASQHVDYMAAAAAAAAVSTHHPATLSTSLPAVVTLGADEARPLIQCYKQQQRRCPADHDEHAAASHTCPLSRCS